MLHSFLYYPVGEICGMRVMASMQDLGKCSASKDASYAIFCLEGYPPK